MTAATIVESKHAPIPGIKKGKWTAQNGYTTKFGWNTVVGCVLTVDDDNDAIVTSAISSGEVTIKLVDDAGSNISSNVNGYYIAWGY